MPQHRLIAMPHLLRALLAVLLLGLGHVDGKAKLYHYPLFSSSRVVQLIFELDLTQFIEIVSLNYKDMKEESYLKLNPHGTVPTYEEDGWVLVESAAIITYLCEKYDLAHHLLPKDLKQRAKFFQFAHYSTATLYSKAGGLYVHEWEYRPGLPGEANQNEDVIKENKDWLHKHFVPFLERELGEQLYLLGNEFSAADVVLGWEMMLLGKTGFLGYYPTLQKYYDRLAQRLSFRETYPALIHMYCVWPHTQYRCSAIHEEKSVTMIVDEMRRNPPLPKRHEGSEF